MNQDVFNYILSGVEEVEDRKAWYPIRMKSTGLQTHRKIGWMGQAASTGYLRIIGLDTRINELKFLPINDLLLPRDRAIRSLHIYY